MVLISMYGRRENFFLFSFKVVFLSNGFWGLFYFLGRLGLFFVRCLGDLGFFIVRALILGFVIEGWRFGCVLRIRRRNSVFGMDRRYLVRRRFLRYSC